MISKLKRKIVKFFKIFILKDKFHISHRRWVKDNGDSTLRLQYDLNEDSIVFDLGGYHGNFSEEIFYKYNATIYVFEPVKAYYEIIKDKFKNNQKVTVFNFGLSDKDETLSISVSESASSIYNESDTKEEIKLKAITSFLETYNISYIDLFKINIEGGEFDVLPEIINTGYINKIKDLQIQFHTFVNDAEEKRKNIRESLDKTHTLTYDYYFIWENWKKNVEK